MHVEAMALFRYKIGLVPDFAWLVIAITCTFTLTLQIETFVCVRLFTKPFNNNSKTPPMYTG